jgi:hypothetical protein
MDTLDLHEFDRHLTRCIFCKQDSSTSKAVEHIIPEALGNKEHILPRGVVCDSCNSYFGLKVEKPLLDSDYFRQARSRNLIYNKENRVPSISGVLFPGFIPIEWDQAGHSVFAARERDTSKLIDVLRDIQEGKLIVPMIEKPDEHLMSRFLAKTALEVLASRLSVVPGGLEEVIDKRELDELRHYARFGTPPKLWPFNTRAIYPEGKMFVEGTQKYEVLHEYTLLYTESRELYLVVVILGIEYAINMGEPETDGYVEWLREHSFKSPLYIDNIT